MVIFRGYEMFAFSIFWLIGLAVALVVLFGAFQALRICIFGSKELSHSKITKIRAGSAIAIALLGFGLFYGPVMDYWALSQVLNIHGKIGSVQYAGSDFDGFLLVVDDKGRFMPKTSVVLDFQPQMPGGATAKMTGITNANGLLVLEEKVPDDLPEGKYNLIISANNHGRKRTQNTQIEVRLSPLRVYMYSDRKIYKPGHTIHFAGYAWEKSHDSFLPYSFEMVNISVKNEKGLVIYKREEETDDYGQFTLDFPLSVTANEGTYTFCVQAGGMTESYEVDVEKYEKPTINLDINTENWIVRGEKLDISFLATYLFGEPVSEAYLDISAYCESYPSGKVKETVKVWNGEYKYMLDTGRLRCRSAREHLVIEGKITDALSGEVQTEKKTVLVVNSGLLLEVSSGRNAYKPGDLVNVRIAAQQPDGTPAESVSSKITVTKYYNGQTSTIFSEDKQFSGTYNYIFNYPEDADYLKVQVSASRGKYSASAAAHINFRPDDYWNCRGRCDFEGVPDRYRRDIVVEPDKSEYGNGESAVISVYARQNYANKPIVLTVSTPFKTTLKALNLDDDARAEVVLEYDDIAPFSSIFGFVYNNGFVESLPVYVSACADKEIDVKLDFLRSDYKPRDVVDLTIETGKPNAQVTLGVVDESIMLLKNYEFSPFESMYSLSEGAGLNNVATRNPRTSGSGGPYFALGMIVLVLICGYVLSVKYMKEGKVVSGYAGADRRFLFLGIGGVLLIIVTFLLGIMAGLDESPGFLLLGIGCVAILVSVAGIAYGAFRKQRGSKWLAGIGLVGGLMFAVPLLLAIIEVYEPRDEFLVYLALGSILLIISFVGEAVKSKSGLIIIATLIILVVFAFFGIAYFWIMSLQSNIGATADIAMDTMEGLSAPTGRGGHYEEEYKSGESMRDKGLVPADIKIRTSFPDTAVWLSTLRTDGAGKVRVPVMLPDTITAWRLEALAATKSAEIGSARDSVISKMDYFVKAAPPSEVTVGDEITVSMVVFNNHNEAVESTVCVSSSTARCGMSSSKFRIVSGEPSRSVAVPAHSSRSARWRVKFTGYGYANMSFLAYSSSEPSAISDGLTKPVLVKPKEEIKSDVYSGVVDNNEVEFEIFSGAIPEFTSASLVIQPSLEAVSLDSVEGLARYPHGCAEQVMSGLYPDILVKQYLAKSGQLTPEFEEEVDKMIISGLQKIYSYHHSDGGWGWYENDKTKVFMTAYVLYGLSEARNAGFFIDDAYINGAKKYLSSVQKPDGSFKGAGHLSREDMTMTASVTHALLNSGMDKDSSTVKRAMSYLSGKYKSSEMKSPYVIALYALCLDAAGDTGELSEVLLKLDSMKRVEGDNVYWSDDKSTRYYSYSLGGAVTTTATAALAFINSEDTGYHDSVGRSVDWLVSKRGSYGWGQTSDSAAVIKTITEYARLSGESVDGRVSVYFNGAHVGSYDVSDNNRAVVYELGLDYKAGRNVLRFSKDGSGTVYYTVDVKQVRVQKEINEKTLGISKKYLKTKVGVGEKLPVTITLSNRGDSVYYVVVEDVVPPGFVVDDASLESAIDSSENLVEYEVCGSDVYFYIGALGSETIRYNLKAVNEGIVFGAPAKVYAMYDPENRDESVSYSLEVS
ncbi:MAG: MG2 domain-containing protein [archaeon]|nr:MG2 domain-containing protein [archaeon]